MRRRTTLSTFAIGENFAQKFDNIYEIGYVCPSFSSPNENKRQVEIEPVERVNIPPQPVRRRNARQRASDEPLGDTGKGTVQHSPAGSRYTVSHRQCGQFRPYVHENFEQFKMKSIPTGSWIRSRLQRDRIQLTDGVEILLNFSKLS